MNALESLGTVYSSDVLIIGGGIGGLFAAIRLKEEQPDLDVLVVEKATAGYSGAKANRGAGVLFVMDESDDIDKFIEHHVNNHGHYLEDQEILEKTCRTTREMVAHFERWGIKAMREPDGKLAKIKELPLWSLCGIDLDFMTKLRNLANKLGVRFVDKTQAVELLTQGDRVVGTVGFNIIDGGYSIFKAKSTILATGSCNWMVTNMWYSGRGDGLAAAYRAGAEMRNAEFSNFYNIGLRGNMSCQVGAQYALYNNDGEYISAKYCKDNEPDVDVGIFLGMEKEIMEGKGPIRFEETELFVQNPISAGGFLFRWQERKWAIDFWHTLMEKEEKYTVDHAWRPEVIPNFIGEFAPLKVDHEMRSTLKGLWGIGDTTRAGSCISGACPPPGRLRGSGLMWASVSAILAVPSVIENAKAAEVPEPDFNQVKGFKDAIYEPMTREHGLDVRNGINRLKEAIAPPRFAIRKHKERIEEALDMIAEVKRSLPAISPENDWHYLGLYHDLKNMILCAEIYYAAALERKETRGWQVREDYPERDDRNWLKWIIVKDMDGKMTTFTEDIPIAQYKFKP